MRRLIFFSFCALFWLGSASGDSLLVLTWNLHNFPSGVYNLRKPELEGTRIAAIAEEIRKRAPDILLLQEVRDSAACLRLIDSIGDSALMLHKCSSFTDYAGIPTFQQLAVISRFSSTHTVERRWSSFGVVDPPRGFVATVLSTHIGNLVVCNVHLKSNRTTGDVFKGRQLNILKRELAAEQLLAFTATYTDSGDNAMDGIIICGDFNTNIDNSEFVSEGTLSYIHKVGFQGCFDGVNTENRITWKSSGEFPDATYDYIFANGLEFLGPPSFLDSDKSDHKGVLCTIGAAK